MCVGHSGAQEPNPNCGPNPNPNRDPNPNPNPKVQNYFLSLSELSGVVPRPDLFFRLSPTIANKIILDIHRVWINRLPFTAELRSEKSKFANGPLHRDQVDGIDGLLCKIALGMTPALFVPDDMSLVGRMHVIIKGVGLNLCTGQLLINGAHHAYMHIHMCTGQLLIDGDSCEPQPWP